MVIKGPTYGVEIEWDRRGRPVLYITATGYLDSLRSASDGLTTAIRMINDGPFSQVCVAYNLLALEHVPFLGGFLISGNLATSRTVHLIVGTTHQTARMIASVQAAAGGKRRRTLDICKSEDEMEAAIQRWLPISTYSREYLVQNPLRA